MQWRVAIVLVISVGAACSRSGTAPDTADSGVEDSLPDATGESVFDVHIFDASQALAGGTVCVVGQSDCEIADGNGDVTVTVIGKPYDLKLAFAATMAGHLSTVELGRIYLQLDVSVHTVPSDVALLVDADASNFFTAAGFAYPATSTGFIRATVFDGVTGGAEQGATVTLDGSNNAPVYLDDNGRPDRALTAIGPGGGVVFGDVPAGPFGITVHVADKACIVQSFAWDGSGSAGGVVVAGALTDGITLACYATK